MRLLAVTLLAAVCLAVSIQQPCSSYVCRYTATVVKTDDPTTHHDLDINHKIIGQSLGLSISINGGEDKYVPSSSGDSYWFAHVHGDKTECDASSFDEVTGMYAFFILPFLEASKFVHVGPTHFFGVKAEMYHFDSADIVLNLYVDASTGMPLGGETSAASMSWSFVYTNIKAGVNDADAWKIPSSCGNSAVDAARLYGNFMHYTHEELLAMGATYHEVPEGFNAASSAVDYTAGPTHTAPAVLDQGMCGSCWAHATVSSLFGQIRKASAKGIAVPQGFMPSRQFLMDFAPADIGDGCEGGSPPAIFQWLQTAGPIPTEAAYPYQEVDHKCDISGIPSNLMYPAGLVKAVKIVPEGDEAALLHALQTVGPIAIGVCDDLPGFQGTDRIAKTTQKCTPDKIGHAVTLVGAGVDEITGEEYWEVQNSWSYMWRDSGRIRIARNRGDQYGVALMAAYPVIDASKIPF
ncbi:Papain family cysteine protease [Carpediemonas membranifera]|uniref:Papain family cysteine protease n=1 Tax=Carpediemonas membranifera TaxID=201153 RepID=A0A8J6DZC5_9EUKA|nr:Papain family cysteine protease [Carpediemonas membranifera]|eukprot:KAG9390533.1 Papain family cysteine protease [Carpediemonas membranifera]